MAKESIIQPYSEIIKVDEAFEDYKKLCEGKSTKYKTYTDWKKAIEEKFRKLDSEEKRENFKHFLIYKIRESSNINGYFIPVMTCFLSFLLGNIRLILPDADDNKIGKMLFSIIAFVVTIIGAFDCFKEMVNNKKETNLNYCFYSDLLDVLEPTNNKP